jgi:hypothetical protein
MGEELYRWTQGFSVVGLTTIEIKRTVPHLSETMSRGTALFQNSECLINEPFPQKNVIAMSYLLHRIPDEQKLGVISILQSRLFQFSIICYFTSFR